MTIEKSNEKSNENITYSFNEYDENQKEYDKEKNDDDLQNMLKEFEDLDVQLDVQADYSESFMFDILQSNHFHEEVNYDLNYNVKQLTTICEYYGIKAQKMKKQEIIENIVVYENNSLNHEMVMKRKLHWFYMNELKNDKFMKKYVLWN